MMSVAPLTERALKYNKIWNGSGSQWLSGVVHVTLFTPPPWHVYVCTYAPSECMYVCMEFCVCKIRMCFPLIHIKCVNAY